MAVPIPEHRRIDRYTGPYERWAFTPELGRPFALPPGPLQDSRHISALVEGVARIDDLAACGFRVPPLWSGGDAVPHILPLLLPAPPQAQTDADAALCAQMAGLPGARYRLGYPLLPDTVTPEYDPTADAQGWRRPATPPRAIVAVIDSGIPFAHRAFLDSTGHSRISHVWLHAASAGDRACVPFGREFTNGQIDDLRQHCAGNEPEVYRAAGILRPGPEGRADLPRRAATHGAHVAGLAAGNSSLFADAMPDEVQIIAVQLPDAISLDSSGIGKDAFVLAALHYIFDRARRIALACGTDTLPLFVNLSFGWTAGRHDGASALEEAMQQMLTDRRKDQPLTEIVLPTGNEFANRQHARIEPRHITYGRAAVFWQIQPDDRTSSYLELWFPARFDPSGWSLRLTPPHGLAQGGGCIAVSPDPANTGGDPRRFVDLTIDGQIIGQMSADRHRGTRWRVLLALAPTVPIHGQARRAPAGRWQIEIVADPAARALPEGESLQVWVQRDDDPVALNSGGRQGYLIAPAPAAMPDPLRIYDGRRDMVTGYGVINAIATAPDLCRVGGYVRLSGYPSRYSGSAVVLADGSLSGPGLTASAVADDSPMRPGILSIGVCSGMRSRFTGTSVAAPQVVRHMALNCIAGRPIMEGCSARPDHLSHPRAEPLDGASKAQHHARLGPVLCPPAVRIP